MAPEAEQSLLQTALQRKKLRFIWLTASRRAPGPSLVYRERRCAEWNGEATITARPALRLNDDWAK